MYRYGLSADPDELKTIDSTPTSLTWDTECYTLGKVAFTCQTQASFTYTRKYQTPDTLAQSKETFWSPFMERTLFSWDTECYSFAQLPHVPPSMVRSHAPELTPVAMASCVT